MAGAQDVLERGDMPGHVAREEDIVGSHAVTFFRGTRLSLVPQDPLALPYLVFPRYVNSQIKPLKPSVLGVLIKRDDKKRRRRHKKTSIH